MSFLQTRLLGGHLVLLFDDVGVIDIRIETLPECLFSVTVSVGSELNYGVEQVGRYAHRLAREVDNVTEQVEVRDTTLVFIRLGHTEDLLGRLPGILCFFFGGGGFLGGFGLSRFIRPGACSGDEFYEAGHALTDFMDCSTGRGENGLDEKGGLSVKTQLAKFLPNGVRCLILGHGHPGPEFAWTRR
ncbi:MAG: hypothetical protein WBW88_19875 [Rhodothermales bacterium]